MQSAQPPGTGAWSVTPADQGHTAGFSCGFGDSDTGVDGVAVRGDPRGGPVAGSSEGNVGNVAFEVAPLGENGVAPGFELNHKPVRAGAAVAGFSPAPGTLRMTFGHALRVAKGVPPVPRCH